MYGVVWCVRGGREGREWTSYDVGGRESKWVAVLFSSCKAEIGDCVGVLCTACWFQ